MNTGSAVRAETQLSNAATLCSLVERLQFPGQQRKGPVNHPGNQTEGGTGIYLTIVTVTYRDPVGVNFSFVADKSAKASSINLHGSFLRL